MSQVFKLPDLGEGLTEAEISQWLVAVGDVISVDQPIVEVETAKAAVEVPSPFAGTVVTLHGVSGQVLAVGTPLITVAAAGQTGSVESTPADRPEVATSPSVEAAASPGPSGAVLIGYGTSGEAQGSRRRRRAAQASAPAAADAAQAMPEQPLSASVVGRQAPRVSSPLVRKLARDNGVDISALAGSGPEGLILRRDVEAALGTGDALEASASSTPEFVCGTVSSHDPRTGLTIASRTPVRGVRKSVARAMEQSRREIPEATVWVDVDATRLMKLRSRLKEQTGSAPGVLAFVSRFALAGLERFPELAMRVEAGADGHELVAFDGVNLGFAAQTPRGLVVPSVEHAERMTAMELDAALRELTAKAREGRCSPTELTRGTFTVNNYGVFGVDGSAAIINAPEVAILGLGRIIERAWVVPSRKGGSGRIKARQVMELTLAFDHRVCDGGTAGGFLRFVADCIENPTGALAQL
jgi:pyruvate dehydrogenase E2 component (dihydrolipoamide acetyltransferase)